MNRYDAEEYDKGRRGESVDLWVKEASRIANLNKDSKILDLGCGTGIYTLEFKRKESLSSICGLDPDFQMTKSAITKGSEKLIGWCIGVGENIPFKSEVFDCIFSSQVWHHIKDKRKAASECFRVLKDKSPLIIRTISHEQWRRKTVTRFFPKVLEVELRRYPSNKDFEEYFSGAGFKGVEFHDYEIERYTFPDEFIEAAQKKLWSMFWHLSKAAINKGVGKLLEIKDKDPDKPIRNDELITLVVAWK